MSEERRKVGSEENTSVNNDVRTGTTNETGGKPVAKKKMKNSTRAVIIVVCVVVAAIGVYFGLSAAGIVKNIFAPSSPQAEQEAVVVEDGGVIYDGVSCMGVDLSGAEVDDEQKIAELKQASKEILASIDFDIVVSEDHTVDFKARHFGAYIDVEKCMENAYLVGRSGNSAEDAKAVEKAETSGIEVDYAVEFSDSRLPFAINNILTINGIAFRNAELDIKELEDEEELTTTLEVSFIEECDGIEVDPDDLGEKIKEALANKDYTAKLSPLTTVKEAEIKMADMEELYCKQGSFRTTYKDSISNRRYNIWKMSAIINGVVIQPGEVWSINEEAGPRTYARGWKGANGINGGQYVVEAGGGICQVSTTLYNACLKTEIEIVDRKHHSWPSDYVPVGLDATISTGYPDFKISNPYDTPIIIAADCNAGEGYVEVSIYCPKMDYTLEFVSDVISVSYSGAREDIVNPEMEPGTEELIIKEHPRQVANIYVQKYDLDGNKIGDLEFVYKDVYDNKPAKYNVGPPLEEEENKKDKDKNKDKDKDKNKDKDKDKDKDKEEDKDNESSNQGTTDPGTTDPGATDPGTSDPGTSDPGTSDPGTSDPGTTDPGTTDPGTTDPGATDPGATDPGATDPGATS